MKPHSQLNLYRTTQQSVFVSLAILLRCFTVPGDITAAPITFSLSGMATGSLGAQAFTLTPFTITSTANTDQVYVSSADVYLLPNISTEITVSGLPSAVFTQDIVTFSNNNACKNPDPYSNFCGLPEIGVSSLTQNRLILSVQRKGFPSYDLSTSYGPITGYADLNPNHQFPTDQGLLSFWRVSRVTFSAITVPEPSSHLASMASLTLGFALIRNRVRNCI